MIRKTMRYIFTVFISMVIGLLCSISVNAYTYKKGTDSVMDKIVAKNTQSCINIFKSELAAYDLETAKDHLPLDANSKSKVPMPNTIISGSSSSSPTLSCYDFFAGKGNWSGVIGRPKSNTIDGYGAYLESLGYQKTSTGTVKNCITAHIENSHVTDESGGTITEPKDKICLEVDSSGIIWSLKSEGETDTSTFWWTIEGAGNGVALNSAGTWGGVPLISTTSINFGTTKWVDFYQELQNNIVGGTATKVNNLSYVGTALDNDARFLIYKKPSSNALMNSILGSSAVKTLSTADVYNTYIKYFKNDTYVKLSCSDTYDYANDKTYNWIQVKLKRKDKIDSNCYVHEVVETKYTGASPYRKAGTYYFTKENMSLSDIVKQINSFNLEAIINDIDNVEDAIVDDGASTEDTSENGNVEPTCANSGGAESLGWIVCPVLNWLKNAATEVYESALEPALQVEPKLFTESGGGTEKAWSFFQGMANVLFVILFLFVIFSQLTGVGIDNYGIKKIMPKLIVVAILINLSYLICVLCVDLSNVVGNGLQSLFDGLPTGSPDSSVAEALGSGAGATTITAVILLAGLGGGALVVWKNPAILISLLVGALGVVIAIFFVFVLLAAREAAIIVLTVLSPLAFACYMLPNTKIIFDKWLKFWKGLLLLYPICGALIGGGNFVSNLLLSAGIATQGFWSALTAMLVGIIPIFFIPIALKNAFAAMGTIGSKITGFGDRVRSGAAKNIRNSDSYKNLQKRGLETGIRRKAGYDRDGNPKKLNGFQRFIRGGRRNVQRNALAYQKLRAEKGALEATEGKDFMLETETANEAKRIVANGEANRIGAVGTANSLTDSLYRALMSEDRAKIRAYTDALSVKGEDGRAAVRSAYDKALGAGMSGDAAATFADNIMAKHAADYKNNNRSMFEVAKDINLGNPAQSTNAYISSPLNRAHLADSVTATTIGNMDDGSFEETFGGYHGKTVDIPMGANRIEVGRAAYDALHDQNANIKGKRREYLQEIVNKSGYRPPVQKVKVIT